MENTHSPDGNCANITDLSKWPLQPGVLVHVNKLNGVSISQLSPRISPFKTTSVTRAKTYLKYKRNKSKVYARLERLKELLGINRSPHHVPIGIKESEGGVVTFKRVTATPTTRPEGVASRKRKKPGDAPKPSSIEDKARLGAAPPVGGTADPLSDNDKGFYENLPFHGMQNPPNKNQYIPSIFSQLPPSLAQTRGFNTISGVSFQNAFNNPQTIQNSEKTSVEHVTSPIALRPNRIIGRNEYQYDIRKTASGINLPENKNLKCLQNDKMVVRKSYHMKKFSDKRFSSLEVKKHKSYSPTFYSIRCKKHPKRRSIVFMSNNKGADGEDSNATNESDNISKDKPEANNKSNENKERFQNLTDSIQIFEQSLESTEKDDDNIPVPAPRSKKQKREIVYANVSPGIQSTKSDDSNTSTETVINNKPEISVTEVQVHAANEASNEAIEKSVDAIDATIKDVTNKTTNTSPKLIPKPIISPHALKNSPVLKVSPNFIKPKVESPKGALSLQIKAKIKPPLVQSPADNPSKSIVADIKDDDKTHEPFPEIPKMPILNTQIKWSPNIANQNAFYTLTTPHFKQLSTVVPPQYSATIPHQKHAKLIPRALFQEQLPKSKSFSSKSKQKKHHFQIPLQKCHSFKFQTAESYFQPIKNIHEENLMRNGYVTDYPESSHHGRRHKRDKPKQKTKGPLVLRRPGDYQENIHFQENIQNSVQLQYPQPILGASLQSAATNKPNGVVYADLDMPASDNQQSSFDMSSSKQKPQKTKPKTEYATLKLMEQPLLLVIHIFSKPYRPDPCDLEYADIDYKSYGPINYKAASIYAAMKRNKNNNKMEEVNKEDLL
ncbi:hypothetical protein NQ315_004029 [Exocentrus adspersus]|uniref:Uncharacterized protein n=1 Tax=Exocentrus adspersus TaxID=1586481 RepID=A0AAV8W652_9CUCU|nr:hypothetical protein NQ315_004029 [Exocentrus adspersus]